MISRREFGKYMAGVSALTLLGQGQSVKAQAGRPTLTIAVDNLWSNLNTVLGISTTTIRFFTNFYSRLVERDFLNDPEGVQLKPGIATEWSRDGKVWTIKVREGVKFHNGETLTAEDVAFTLSAERLWGAEPFEPRGKTFAEGFVRVEAIDSHTVEIETAREDLYIPNKLTGFIGLVVPKKAYLEMGVNAFGQAPIGSGPYRVTRFSSGDVLEMEAFDDHWDGAPPAAKVVWKIVPEFAGRMAGLVSGEFDFIVNVPTDQEDQMASYSNVTVARAQAGNYTGFVINTLPEDGNPLADINLRKALVQGVDMHAVVKALWGDRTFHPDIPFNFPDYGPFYDPSMPVPLPYDPEAAKALVAASAYKGEPLRWHITRQFYANYEIAAEIMVEMWRQVGLNVTMVVLDSFQLAYQKPFHLLNVSVGTSFIPGDPYQPLWLDFGPASAPSVAAHRNWAPSPAYLAAGEEFLDAKDFDSRKAAYLKLSKAWQDVTPAYFMWRTVYNWAHRLDIGFVARADGEMRMFGDYLKLPA